MKKDNDKLELFEIGQQFYWDYEKGEFVEDVHKDDTKPNMVIIKVDAKNKIIMVKEIK